ncbi:hypothetical protein ACFL2H_07035 [Planctomycetota bacterium]
MPDEDYRAVAMRLGEMLRYPENELESPMATARIADAKGLLCGIAEGNLLTGQSRIAEDLTLALASGEPGIKKPQSVALTSVLHDAARNGLSLDSVSLLPRSIWGASR